MVNLQDTPSAGQISAADLDAARQHSTGRIVHLRRAVVLPHGRDGQGKYRTRQWPEFPDTVPTDWHGLDACAAEGGRFMEPAPAMESMWRHRRAAATVRGGVALVVLLAVVGYVVRTVWPLA
jgi:hypothetical protein